MEQDSGYAREEDGTARMKHLPHKQHWANPAAGNSQCRLGRCSRQPQREASFREIGLFRYPTTHDFRMLWPNMETAAGMPRSCCYKIIFYALACPLSNCLSSTQKQFHPKTSPLLFGKGSPREKRMKQSESEGRRDAARKDVLHSYSQ